jgi:hypothetical protein
LDIFKSVVLEVLQVDDPSFELPGEERYAAAIHESSDRVSRVIVPAF